MFTFKSAQSIHCRIASVIGDSQGIFSVEMNNYLLLIKHSPLISDELNVDVLFESDKHYELKINISLFVPSQTVSIFLQSSGSVTSDFLVQCCFACKSESSLQPIQIQVLEPSAICLRGFDCNVEFNVKPDQAMEGSFLWVISIFGKFPVKLLIGLWYFCSAISAFRFVSFPASKQFDVVPSVIFRVYQKGSRSDQFSIKLISPGFYYGSVFFNKNNDYYNTLVFAPGGPGLDVW